MKRIVERHEPTYYRPKEEVWKYKAEWSFQELQHLQEYKDKFEEINWAGIPLSFFHNLCDSSYYGISENYLYNYLYYYNQLQYARFVYGMNDGKKIRLQIADREIETVGKFKNSYIGTYFIRNGIMAASILRDKEKLAFYADIPLDFPAQTGQEDLIYETMLMFYQVLIKGNGTANEAIASQHHIKKQLDWDYYIKYVVQEGFNDEYVWRQLHKYRSQEAIYQFLPVLEIYHHILNKNQVGFENAVYQALLKWKEYYLMRYIDENQEDIDHSTRPEGFLALPIIAACAYAFDRGMKLETVESDYLCQWMIEGRFDGFELLVK